MGADGVNKLFCLYLSGDDIGIDISGIVIMNACLLHTAVCLSQIRVIQSGHLLIVPDKELHRLWEQCVVEVYNLLPATEIFVHSYNLGTEPFKVF